MAAVDDSPALVLAQSKFELLVGEAERGDGLVGGSVQALPLRAPTFYAKGCALSAGSVLLVCTDGLALPLANGNGEVGRTLVRELSNPPDIVDFARLLDFSRSTYDDDRTLIAVWPQRAVSTLELEIPAPAGQRAASDQFAALRLEAFGELVPLGRPGGQGRVYRSTRIPAKVAAATVVVKLYRRPPSAAAVDVLVQMIAWSRTLDSQHCAHLHRIAAWPLAIITARRKASRDRDARRERPLRGPVRDAKRRQERVLVSLEHLLGGDHYLQLRGLGVRLDTTARTEVAERISGALGFLHRHGIVASDIAPNNLFVAFGRDGPTVCVIDCDSMVFHGRPALPPVETADWQIPPGFSEPPRTRAADAYKLGLVVVRLFARSHDARLLTPYVRHVPTQLRDLLARSLSPDAANRPPTGEWQLALRRLLADGRLNERYPGPAPAPILTSLARRSIQRPAELSPARALPPGGRARPGTSPTRQHPAPGLSRVAGGCRSRVRLDRCPALIRSRAVTRRRGRPGCVWRRSGDRLLSVLLRARRTRLGGRSPLAPAVSASSCARSHITVLDFSQFSQLLGGCWGSES